LAGKRANIERRHQEVARRLGTAILTGAVAEGETLGGEIIALQTGRFQDGLSRSIEVVGGQGPAREQAKLGTRSTERHKWSLLDPDILAWTFQGEPDPAFVHALFELRGIIEPAAAELAAQRRSDEQLRLMEQALEAMAKHTLSEEKGRRADREFHRLIFAGRRQPGPTDPCGLGR